MGGSRGSGGLLSSRDLEDLRNTARRHLQDSRVDAEVNSFLQQQLTVFNTQSYPDGPEREHLSVTADMLR